MASLSDSRLLLAASLSAAAGAAMVFLLSPYEKKQLSSSGDSSHGSEATTRSASPPEPPATDAASQTLTSVQQTWTWRYSLYSGTLAAAMGALGAVAVGYVVSGRWRSVWLGRAFRARVVGIIPARYHSSRFPGKPLANILGKAMIQRTWEQARQAKTLEAVVIATDDERIAAYCRDFGAEVVMTSPECENGTVRCCEAMEALGTQRWDAVVNIQGDEPLVDPAAIDAVVMALQGAPRAVCSTAVAPLDLSDARNSNRVKCVVDRKGYAMYFSRALIPANKSVEISNSFPYLLHLGLMCYDSNFLLRYAKMKTTPLQLEEDLEQLRILECGQKIKVICVNHRAHGVDTPEDVPKVEAILLQKGLGPSNVFPTE